MRASILLAACEVILISAAATFAFGQNAQLPPPVPKLKLADLDVIFIEITPKYPPGGDFKYTADGQCIRAIEDPPVKHWPDPGEEMTLIAHVTNKGAVPSSEVRYTWMLDGQPGNGEGWSGKLKALEPDEETQVKLKWKWSQEPHRILFMADPENKLFESCERNNCREDQTNAKSLQMRVTENIHKAFSERPNAIGSYSFEDWCQENVRILNQMLAAAVWPSTPNGCLERVRIDDYRVMTQEEMAKSPPQSFGNDGGWNFYDGNFPQWTSFAMSCNLISTVDWGLMHELAHQIGLIDVYGVETTSVWCDETDPESPTIKISYRTRTGGGIMATAVDIDGEGKPRTGQYIRIEPDLRVVQGKGFGRDGFSEWDAAALNNMLDLRRGHFGLFLSDLAKENCIRILDRTGKPVAGATVATFPQELPSRKTARKPLFSGKTDANGIVNLGAHPFGEKISCLGINALLFVRVTHPKLQAPEYHWADLGDFNIAYWAEKGQRVVIDYNTGLGATNAPQPPAKARIVTGDDGDSANDDVTLLWEPSSSKDIVSYRVYTAGTSGVPMPSREKPFSVLLKEVPPGENLLKLTAPYGPEYRFAVTAVNKSGVESSDAATPITGPLLAE